MTRTLALLLLVALLGGCHRYHSRAQGPFRKPAPEPPPPYGANAPPKPLGNQSPLGIASTTPTPTPSADERFVVPPKSDAPLPNVVVPDADAEAFPPFRKRQEPKPALPSPFAPKTDAPKADGAKSLAELKALVATAGAAWKAVDTLEATITRREVNPQGTATSEVVLFQFRREPMSVFTRTTSESGKGREVVFNPAKHGDNLYIMVGQGDHKLLKAGTVLPGVSPDDSRVKEKARYSIRDTGLGKNVTRIADAVAKVEVGKLPADALTYLGAVKRDEYPYPLAGVTLALRPGDDPLFPNGGKRTYYFDTKEKSPSFGLSVLTFATDAKGNEAEYYLFEKVKSPADLTDAHFDPKRLGKK